MKFHKLTPACLSPEIHELYLPSWNTISPPFLVFRQLNIDIFYMYSMVNIYIYSLASAEQKPKAPVYIFQNCYSFCFSNQQAPADMLIQQTQTILTFLMPPIVLFSLWGRSQVNEQSWKRQESWTRQARQKQQQFYSRVEGKAAAWWCFLLGRWPPPWAGRASAPSQSRTWTWACCPGPTGAALGRNCCWGLGTQSHFAPDRYWLWPVFWGWCFHSAEFGAERNVEQWDLVC